jgi:hypothetical protein
MKEKGFKDSRGQGVKGKDMSVGIYPDRKKKKRKITSAPPLAGFST